MYQFKPLIVFYPLKREEFSRDHDEDGKKNGQEEKRRMNVCACMHMWCLYMHEGV